MSMGIKPHVCIPRRAGAVDQQLTVKYPQMALTKCLQNTCIASNKLQSVNSRKQRTAWRESRIGFCQHLGVQSDTDQCVQGATGEIYRYRYRYIRRSRDKLNLKLRHPRCICNNEVKGQSKSKHNWFFVWVLKKRHVSPYSEAIIRFTKF